MQPHASPDGKTDKLSHEQLRCSQNWDARPIESLSEVYHPHSLLSNNIRCQRRISLGKRG